METDEPVYQGFLLLPPSGKILKKSWQKKYCLLYKSSKFGIGRFEIYETDALSGQPKIITLENVIKITPKLPNVFSILTKTAEYEFGTIFEEQVDDAFNDWFRAVQSVAFPCETTHMSSGMEENNDLYCSTDEGVFYVKLHPSDASKRCKLSSKNYTLVITQTALQLRSEVDNKLLYTWPYCYIRRYGYKDGKFTFEAGRKCASGEGTFFLEHPHEQDIYRCLNSKMKSIKKLIGESKSPILDCGDAQLQAAFSMEARSRSPLPASPTTLSLKSTHNSFQDSSLSPSKTFSLSSLESMNSAKLLPKKPPRKSIPTKNFTMSPSMPVVTLKTDHDYIDINLNENEARKYDLVQLRREAWKTLGVETPSHTEQVNEEDEYTSWGDKSLAKTVSEMKLADSETKLNEKSLAPAVITEPSISGDGQFYDHLVHFGSTSRLNVSSGYKQVLPPPLPPVVTVPTDNHYDEVQFIEPVRPADDSYLGYAQIKKDPNTGVLKEVNSRELANKAAQFKETKQIPHQFHNDKAYAVVSKPKRV